MRSMWRRITTRVPPLAIGVLAGLLVGGGAYAVATNGVHGGPKPRFHDASECNLVDVSKLPGNWTHGDYVSAVEKKDPSKVQEAAHSRCGKPTHAGHGNKDKAKKDKDRSAKTSEPSPKPAKPSPKPSSPKRGPTATPSPTGSASPVVPLETVSPGPSTSASPT